MINRLAQIDDQHFQETIAYSQSLERDNLGKKEEFIYQSEGKKIP